MAEPKIKMVCSTCGSDRVPLQDDWVAELPYDMRTINVGEIKEYFEGKAQELRRFAGQYGVIAVAGIKSHRCGSR